MVINYLSTNFPEGSAFVLKQTGKSLELKNYSVEEKIKLGLEKLIFLYMLFPVVWLYYRN